ncbi:hypothetical protein PSHI8_13130 [Polynucleobacter sp. SHI8]|uniref:hypothetical protein n=1 Tax=unclassified Polynucleobacter TaxID=2640945 RepID=UPI00248F7455|nr:MULTISPECIES: hypothetical protein [unclassified Polynucleobacter]BDW11231.1 hypothetical protein PSHI2_13130 [Polynucleobacter sp. SHI2]BDW13677.1 hypothetical protein PSHI8_13130 [Polynucleobacter sp. SHI8]
MNKLIGFYKNSFNGEESARKVFIYGFIAAQILFFAVNLALNISMSSYLNLYQSYEEYKNTIQSKTIFIFYQLINYSNYAWLSVSLWKCAKNTNSAFGRKLSKFGSVLVGFIVLGFPMFLINFFSGIYR